MPLTLQQVADVAAIDDPVRRNRAITATYRSLALEAAQVIGSRDVNWPAFGAWASATAGRVIRGEGLPVDWGTSAAVAAGNRAIIADIGPRFVVWREQVQREAGPTSAALTRTLDHPLFDGVPRLVDAFTGYHEAAAIAASDPDLAGEGADKRHAELVLRSNIQVAAHEQQLADDFVDAAMPLGGVVGLLTTSLVSVITPDGPVPVQRDVPRPSYLHGAAYPDVLSQLQDERLVGLVREFGQNPGLDGTASDAPSWEDYDERMGYIVCFFRAFLREPRYYDEPPA